MLIFAIEWQQLQMFYFVGFTFFAMNKIILLSIRCQVAHSGYFRHMCPTRIAPAVELILYLVPSMPKIVVN